ncbi:MAG: restriction endonuclease subunit S, partial [Pirellula sp.]
MSFPKYPSYKDSGVEWLGEVPNHWDVKRLKQACHVLPSNVDKKCHDGETPIVLCNYTDVYYNEKITRTIDFMAATASSEQIAKFTLREGDTIITKDSETADDIAVAAYVPESLPGVVCGYHLSMVRPLPNTYGQFVTRLFGSVYAKSCFAILANGLTRVGLGQYELDNVALPFPPFEEQKLIASFLDRETSKINALVGEQRRLIELLKEKRQAVISHAVTKGLNPNAPLKPSGIKWLGYVPEHWEVKPLKYLLSLTSGGTPSKENLAYWDGAVPWASSKDLKVAELFDTQDHITQKALDDGAADLVPPGSILTVVRGMILLHTFPVVVARVPMAINQDLKAVLPKPEITGDFLAWLLRGVSEEILSRTDEAGHGTKVLRIDTWLALQVPVPPKIEQSHIVIAIGKRLAELDSLTAEAERAIELLKE